jgi:Cyclin, N-terminal domain/Cyclin, C-terminal domain
VHAPRRSERLSVVRDSEATSSKPSQCYLASVADMKVQHVAAKRERSKSLALHKAAVQHKSSDFELVSKKNSNEHPVKRRRKLQDMSPGLVRPASRRLDDEFEEIPSKRVRCNFNDVSLVQGDRRSQEHHNLLLTNFEATKYTAGFSPYDISNRGDVLQSPEYVSDIFQRLYQSEVGAMCKIPTSFTLSPISTSPPPLQSVTAPQCYMHNQQCVTPLMRAILVDWIVEVHLQFECVPETLHLAVNIIDRYLTNVAVTRNVLQLVGITALLLASKYEDIYPPEVKNCVAICQPTFTVQQVLDMEADMLGELSFNLTVPTGHPFLQRFLFITNATGTMSIAANYYLERMLQEHDALEFRPSVIAAAAVCLAINHPEIRENDKIEITKPGVVRQ